MQAKVTVGKRVLLKATVGDSPFLRRLIELAENGLPSEAVMQALSEFRSQPDYHRHVAEAKLFLATAELAEPAQPMALLADRVRTLMHRKRLSQAELAGKVGLSAATIRRFLERPSSASISKLKAFAEALGIKLDELLDLHPERPRLEREGQLTSLRAQLDQLQSQPDRQAAGLALEQILNRLFALDGLAPREPFCVVGEQIDGSFELDHETYLVEAKWEEQPLSESGLLVFRGKIEGKSIYTRGVLIAMNGISKKAEDAITRGKQPSFFIVDGYDLKMVLSDDVGLKDFLRQRRRLLAEEGLVVAPYGQLWSGSRRR